MYLIITVASAGLWSMTDFHGNLIRGGHIRGFVKTLLEKSLAKEFGIENVVTTRQSGPKLLDFILSYAIVPSKERPR